MTQLLMKDAKFNFSDECIKSFDILRDKLITALVIISSNWDLDFELTCDASDYAVGAELLAVVYAFDKFRSYLIMSKTVVYTDHSALKYLFSKQDVKPRLTRVENQGLEKLNEDTIQDNFPDEHLMVIKLKNTETDPWYAYYANFLVSKIIPHHLTYYLRKKFLSDVRKYIWDDPYLFKSCPDGIIRRCVFGRELHEIPEHCHMGPTGGHYGADITARKIFESGFY
ncbi:reverse transcriptase domain-containing protein [Tanacetum coccineum]